MTDEVGGRSFFAMKNARLSTRILVPLLFSAAISLAIAHLLDLGYEVLGSEPVSTLAVIGNLAGLVACAASVAVGLRRVSRLSGC
jgi:hypothetical protein